MGEGLYKEQGNGRIVVVDEDTWIYTKKTVTCARANWAGTK